MNKANSNSPEIMHEGNNTVKLKGSVEVTEDALESALMKESTVDSMASPGSGLGGTYMLGASLRFRSPLQLSLSLQHFAI